MKGVFWLFQDNNVPHFPGKTVFNWLFQYNALNQFTASENEIQNKKRPNGVPKKSAFHQNNSMTKTFFQKQRDFFILKQPYLTKN